MLSIASNGPVFKYLKITISNYDDKPLELETAQAKMIVHQLVFSSEDSKVVLYTGSESASKPIYDLKHRLSKPEKATFVNLGSVSENPLFGKIEKKAVPWTKKHKTMLFVIMIAAVIVLGGFIFNSFKSIKQTPPAQ